MIASGGRSAAVRERPRRSTRCRRRSPRRAGWSAARAGSAARRRPRARGPCSCADLAGRRRAGDREHERRARARPGTRPTGGPPFASANPRAIASPSPSRAERPLPARRARRSVRGRRRRDRARGRRCGHAPRRPRPRPSLDGVRRRRGRSAFSITFASARSSWAASTRTGGAPPREPDAHPVSVGAEGLERPGDELVTRPQLRPRLGGAGLQPREVEQVRDQALEAGGSSRIVSSSAARSSSSRSSDELSRPPEAARIAVRGERRSWLTAWRTAVLTASLRRRACRVGRRDRAPPRNGSELADDHGGHEVDGQRDPVLRVRERERVQRREEEEVEREHARDRHGERVGEPVEDGDGQHREQVEPAEAEDRGDLAEPVDRCGDDGHGRRAQRQPGCVRLHVLRIRLRYRCATRRFSRRSSKQRWR